MRSVNRTELKFLPYRVTKLRCLLYATVTDILLANSDELNLNSAKFACPLNFFLITLFGTSKEELVVRNSQYFSFSLKCFHCKM